MKLNQIGISILLGILIYSNAFADNCSVDNWCAVDPLPQSSYLSDVWGTSASNVYAVGINSTILQYDGLTWKNITNPGGGYYAIWGENENDIFVVGNNGAIRHFDGNSWVTNITGNPNDLFGAWGSSGSNVYACGTNGNIQHYNGASWTTGPVMNGQYTLTSIWGSSANDIYAVSYDSVLFNVYTRIIHFDGNSWSTHFDEIPPSDNLYGIWGSSASDIYAVGDNGKMMHFDGNSWSNINSGTTQNLNAIWGSSATDIYAVGANGTIIHFDGVSWSQMSSGTNETLVSIWGSSASDIFIVGSNGIILYKFENINNRPDNAIDDTIIGTGKKAIVLTHGWNSSAEEWAIDDATENGIADKICKSLNPTIILNKKSSYKDSITLRCSTSDWHIYIYDWRTAAQNGPGALPSGLPMTAYGEAFAQGTHLGNILGAKGYSHVHLLAHSAGANLINAAKDWLLILQPKPDIHLTFFDAYDPFAQLRCFRQLSAYGHGADWVDNYVDTRTLDDLFAGDLDATKLYMPYAYNVDVTKWDNRTEPLPPAAALFRHEWPYVFYEQYSFAPMSYDLGFQLSMEGGSSFPPVNRNTGKVCILPSQGNGVELQCQNIASVCSLATNPSDIHTIGDPDVVIGSITKSVSGIVEIIYYPVSGILSYWNLITGSPVWSKIEIDLKKPVNALEFDYEFLSSSGAEGYLTVLIDDRVVGHADERYVSSGKHSSYRLYLGELEPGKHALTFRLEPYTPTQSSIKISNIKIMNIQQVKPYPWTMFLPAISGPKQ